MEQQHPREKDNPAQMDSIKCPHCAHDVQFPFEARYTICRNCRQRLDLPSQFAFLRGLAAFEEGQAIVQAVNPKKKKNLTKFNETYRTALNLFMEAYSSLQVAFQARLGEVQRQVGVEMMASMSQEFMKHLMVSGLEVSYWNSIMVEQTAQIEYDGLKEKLRQKKGSIILRLRWVLRQRQLRNKLQEINTKIKALENQIAFVDIPVARNSKWKP
jgi:hypothetical protein